MTNQKVQLVINDPRPNYTSSEWSGVLSDLETGYADWEILYDLVEAVVEALKVSEGCNE